jgi:hypothetical protein
MFVHDELEESSLGHHGVLELQTREFPHFRLVQIQLVEQPVVRLATHFELQRAAEQKQNKKK